MKFTDILQISDTQSLQDEIGRMKQGQGLFLKTLNVAMSGTASLVIPNNSTSGSSVSINIVHNLGYTPAFNVYLTDPNSAVFSMLPIYSFKSTDGTFGYSYTATANNKSLFITYNTPLGTSALNVPFKYYIFEEPASV